MTSPPRYQLGGGGFQPGSGPFSSCCWRKCTFTSLEKANRVRASLLKETEVSHKDSQNPPGHDDQPGKGHGRPEDKPPVDPPVGQRPPKVPPRSSGGDYRGR
jgi:hypothetical protein